MMPSRLYLFGDAWQVQMCNHRCILFFNEWVGELQVTFKGKGELTRANKITYACLPRRILQFMLVRYHQTN